MPLWRLIPEAHETDPRWMGRRHFAEVVVRAPTAGQARLEAARHELFVAPTAMARAVGNGSEPLGAALEDEKLYSLHPIGPRDPETGESGGEGPDSEGPAGVVAAVPSG